MTFFFDYAGEYELASGPAPTMAETRALIASMRPRKAPCCSACSSTRKDENVRAVVRSAGKLEYGHGTEIVQPTKASLGDPAMLIGVPVRIRHGGPQVGKVLSARISNGALHAVLDVNDEGLRAIANGASQLSAGYATDVVDGVQRPTRFLEVALVEHGRCAGGDGTCAIHPDDIPEMSGERFEVSAEDPEPEELPSKRTELVKSDAAESPDVLARQKMILRGRSGRRMSP